MFIDFLKQLDQPFTAEELFDHLADIVFFVKNQRGEYAVVNQTLVIRCGLPDKVSLIGRKPSAVLRPPLGQSYEQQDQRVLSTGHPLVSQLELHLYSNRDVGWCLTTKLPLRGAGGQILGLVGVSQDLRLPNRASREFQHLAKAVEYAERNLAEAPSVQMLARIAKMSRYQLDRRMRHVFGISTGQWLIKLRIDRAQEKLLETNASIAAIAHSVGYGDQSAFTRQFHQVTGLSPREFRKAQIGDCS